MEESKYLTLFCPTFSFTSLRWGELERETMDGTNAVLNFPCSLILCVSKAAVEPFILKSQE